MSHKVIPFAAISLIIFGMFLLVYTTSILWIKVFAAIISIAGLVILNISYYKSLKRSQQHDKEFFEQTL